METNRIKTHFSENDVIQLLELAPITVLSNSHLRGQGEIAVTLHHSRFGPRAIARFLSIHCLPVSPTTVSKYLTAKPATTETNTTT